MKKYLLAVLALGATMMMACEPANNQGNDEQEVTPDYVLDNTTCAQVMATLDNHGDAFEVGNNLYQLMIIGMSADENEMMAIGLMYNTPATEMNGCGVLTPDTLTEEGIYSFAANTYMPGVFSDPEDPSYVEGSVFNYMKFEPEVDLLYAIVSGTITVTYNEETQENTFSGLVNLSDGKVLKFEHTGVVGGGIGGLKHSLAAEKMSRVFSAALKLKK